MLLVLPGAVNLPVTVWMMRSFLLEVPFETARLRGLVLRFETTGAEISEIRIDVELVAVGAQAAGDAEAQPLGPV